MNKFKVNDKVKIISCYGRYYKDLIGEIGTVKSVERAKGKSNRYYKLHTKKDNVDWSYREDDLELVKEEEFKVGDILRQIKHASYENPIVKVIGFRGNEITHIHKGSSSEGYSHKDHFIRTKEEFKEEFKKGDKIIISIPRDNLAWKYDGIIGIIENIRTEGNLRLDIQLDKEVDGNSSARFSKEEVEKI